MKNNLCQAGHEYHSRVVVDTQIGKMVVYDWNKYKDFKGYCTGQDDISRTLLNIGIWEKNVTSLITAILIEGEENGLFIDIGCNVGWYSRIARSFGYRVEAYDGDKEHLELVAQNAEGSVLKNVWFDGNTRERVGSEGIELIKCDIEGNEQYAIKHFENYLRNKLVKNIVMEVSPIFNNSYPQLINKIVSYGYEAFEIDGMTKFDFNFNFPQKDIWLRLKG